MQIVLLCINRSSVKVGPEAFGPPGTFSQMLLALAAIGKYDVRERVGVIDYDALRQLRFFPGKPFEPCAVTYRLMMIGSGHLLVHPTEPSITVCLTLWPWAFDQWDEILWWVKYAKGSACQVDASLLPHPAVTIERTPTPLSLDSSTISPV